MKKTLLKDFGFSVQAASDKTSLKCSSTSSMSDLLLNRVFSGISVSCRYDFLFADFFANIFSEVLWLIIYGNGFGRMGSFYIDVVFLLKLKFD